MNAQKILFATDFSHTGDAALAYAESLAKASRGQILIVHVVEPPLAYSGGEMYYGVPQPSEGELMEMLHNIKPADHSIVVAYRLVDGEPVTALVDLAKDEGIDLIVIGSHGRSGISRVLMGSVAEGVVRKAHCPVLVCKHSVAKPAALT